MLLQSTSSSHFLKGPRDFSRTRRKEAKVIVKIRKPPPGKAIGADDPQVWARQRNGSLSSLPEHRNKRLPRDVAAAASRRDGESLMTEYDNALDGRARKVARQCGLLARKSRRRRGTIDNLGGFVLIDPERNWIVAGERCNMTAEDVIAYCSKGMV
jgi:hypothetical protein